MPTVVVKTIKPAGGGDYSSLAAWDAARARNLMTADEIERAECHGGGNLGALSSPSGNWVCDATRRPEVVAAAGHRHAGVFDPSKAYIGAASGTLLNFKTFGRVDGIQFEITANSGVSYCVYSGNSSDIHIVNCIMKGFSPSATNHRALRFTYGGNYYVANNIFYNWPKGIYTAEYASQNVFAYNNTFYNCAVGIDANVGTYRAKNNVCRSCTDGYAGSFHADSTNNVSDLASDAPGTNPRQGSVQFVDAAGGNFHLAAADTVARGYGANLSGDAFHPFSTDIDDQARSAPWDCGADQYQDASGTSFQHVAAGGASIGGTSAAGFDRAASASGGMASGGGAAAVFDRTHSASGGVLAGGEGQAAREFSPASSGGGETGGAAGAQMQSGGGGTAWEHDPSGGAVTDGDAGVASDRSADASGGATTGGTGAATLDSSGTAREHQGSGGAVTGGTGAHAFVRPVLAPVLAADPFGAATAWFFTHFPGAVQAEYRPASGQPPLIVQVLPKDVVPDMEAMPGGVSRLNRQVDVRSAQVARPAVGDEMVLEGAPRRVKAVNKSDGYSWELEVEW